MLFHRRILKVGNSKGVVLPKMILEHLNLDIGNVITFELTDHGLRVILTDKQHSDLRDE